MQTAWSQGDGALGRGHSGVRHPLVLQHSGIWPTVPHHHPWTSATHSGSWAWSPLIVALRALHSRPSCVQSRSRKVPGTCMLEIVPGAEGIRQCHDSAKIRSRQQGLEVTTGGRSQWVPVMWPVTGKETDSEKQAELLLAISNPLAHGLSPPSWQSERVRPSRILCCLFSCPNLMLSSVCASCSILQKMKTF